MNPLPHLSVPYISYIATGAIVFGIVSGMLDVLDAPGIAWLVAGTLLTLFMLRVNETFLEWERSRGER